LGGPETKCHGVDGHAYQEEASFTFFLEATMHPSSDTAVSRSTRRIPTQHPRWPAVLVLMFALGAGLKPAQRVGVQSIDPRPVDGVNAIISAFDRNPIVALGDLHGCQELYDFITLLVRHPELPNKTNTIVIEFGNALFQGVADRYISGGDVTLAELRHVWRDHTNPIVFDSPVYEAFFKTVRDVNGALPEGKRFRVLLGDPPIDWTKTTTNKDWGRMLFQRDPHFVSVVDNEVLSKGRRALLIIGGAHLVRGVAKNNVSAGIEARRPGSMYIVIPHDGFREGNDELESRLSGWPSGALALIRGTWLGAIPIGRRWPQMKDAKLPDGNAAKLEDVADAWLYVGRRDALTEAMPFPGIYRDDYWNELQRRQMIMWGRPLDPSSDDFNTSAKYYVKPR